MSPTRRGNPPTNTDTGGAGSVSRSVSPVKNIRPKNNNYISNDDNNRDNRILELIEVASKTPNRRKSRKNESPRRKSHLGKWLSVRITKMLSLVSLFYF